MTVCGWLSPEGLYVSCQTWEHDKVAITYGGTNFLEMEGWMRLMLSGRIFCKQKPTEAQMCKLEELIHEAGFIQYNTFLFSVGMMFERFYEE